MKVRLQIDRLVLEGLPVSGQDAARLKVALEVELGRLLAEGGIGSELVASGTVPNVSVTPMQASRGAAPSEIASGIARSVYSGIGQP